MANYYMKPAFQFLVLFLVLLGCFASRAQSQGHGPDIFSCERQLMRPCDLCYCCLYGNNKGVCYATDVDCRLACPPPKFTLP
uniref:Bowman-Birk serine protease inhibitors family domain-containing protein n=2 Tax=Aegilops tauschii TaxID=37682 RepID=A0A452YUM4_AEGTS